MEVKHCGKCGAEIWGNRIFDLKIGEEHALMCPACAKEFALDMLGRVYVVERYTEEDDSNERG